MYENEIIEVMNCRPNKKLRQWYDAKVKELTSFLVEKLESENIEIQRFKLEKDMQNLRLEIPEEVVCK